MARPFWRGFVVALIGFLLQVTGMFSPEWHTYNTQFHLNTTGIFQYCYGDQNFARLCKAYSIQWDKWNIAWVVCEGVGTFLYLVTVILFFLMACRKLQNLAITIISITATGCAVIVGFAIFVLKTSSAQRQVNIVKLIGYSAWLSFFAGVLAALSVMLQCCSWHTHKKYQKKIRERQQNGHKLSNGAAKSQSSIEASHHKHRRRHRRHQSSDNPYSQMDESDQNSNHMIERQSWSPSSSQNWLQGMNNTVPNEGATTSEGIDNTTQEGATIVNVEINNTNNNNDLTDMDNQRNPENIGDTGNTS